MLSVAVKPLYSNLLFRITKLIHADLLPFNGMGGTTVDVIACFYHVKRDTWATAPVQFDIETPSCYCVIRDLGVAFLKFLSI
jgi:hypothetical protein